MKYIITKKQVEEMYKMVVDNWRLYSENKFTLVIYKDNKKNNWIFTMNDNYKELLKDKVIFEIECENYGIFEWVVLKEIGHRRKYSKKDLIDGIQWNINNNYLKSIA